MKPKRILQFVGLVAAAWLIGRFLDRAFPAGDRQRAIDRELEPFGLN